MSAQIIVEDLYYKPENISPDKPPILNRLSLQIEKGAFVGIIGANGSGKTSFIKHLNGLIKPTDGNVLINGINTKNPNHWGHIRSMVGMVFQNPRDQIVASTVEEDIAFGLENENLPTPKIQKNVRKYLNVAGLVDEAKMPPHLLSGGQIQRLALAGVLARQPDIILFDEPTTMLDPLSRKSLMAMVMDLHKKGFTILFITHNMDEVVQADRVLVFEHGRITLDGPPNQVFSQNQKLKSAGLEQPKSYQYQQVFQKLGWRIPNPPVQPVDLISAIPHFKNDSCPRSSQIIQRPGVKDSVIDIHLLTHTYLDGTPLAKQALRGVNLHIQRQSIHGLAGTNGSGKSTLLQHLNGLLKPTSGQISVGEFQLNDPGIQRRKVVRDVGLVFQNPETQFFEQFVGDEIAYGPQQFDLPDLRNQVKKTMEMLGLDFESYKDRYLETLSGGEKRKVALASTLVLDQDILLFDEPTAGMDPRSRHEMMGIMVDLQQKGKTLVIASHQIDLLLNLSQKISLMTSGKLSSTTDLMQTLLTGQKLIEADLLPPLGLMLVHQLQSQGWPVPTRGIFTAPQLFHWIRGLKNE